MDLEQMRARIADLQNVLRSIHSSAGTRALTPDEQTRWDSSRSELEGLQAQVQEIQTRHDRLRELVQRGAVEDGVDNNPYAGGGRPATRYSPDTPIYGGLRSAAQRTIDQAHQSGQLHDQAAERAEGLINQGSNPEKSLAARWVTLTGSDSYRGAFAKLLADPQRGHLLWERDESEAFRRVAELQTEMRAMSLTAANGGYMVPMTLDPALNLTNAGSINPLRRISRVVQTVTKSWTGLTSAGATAEWKAEAAQAADGSPEIDDTEIPVHFGDSFVPYSFEVGMDALNFLDELRTVLVDAADNLMATAYTTGSGSGQPTGIVTALAAASPSVLVASGTSDAYGKADVYAVQNALPARFQGRAQWAMNLAIINATRQFETANGAKEFPELAQGQLLGRPLNELSNLDGSLTAASDNYVAIYGDFNQFVIVDRIGTTLELIPNLMGANQRPTGQRGALLWFRTGSNVLVPNAFRMLNVT